MKRVYFSPEWSIILTEEKIATDMSMGADTIPGWGYDDGDGQGDD